MRTNTTADLNRTDPRAGGVSLRLPGAAARIDLAVWAAALAVVCLATGAFAQTASSVRVTHTDGYARIEFEWPETVSYEARIENSVLVARFGAAAPRDLTPLTENAADYVAAARRDRDGRTVRVALKGEFRLHASQSFNVVALDLVPAGESEDPPDVVSAREVFETRRKAALEEAARAAAETAEREAAAAARRVALPLRVYVTENPAFSRVVFDWTTPVGYEIAKTPEGVRLRFSEPASPGLVRLRIDPPPFILGADYEEDGQTLTVNMALEDGRGVRHYAEGPRVVIDVTEGGPVAEGVFRSGSAAGPDAAAPSAAPTPGLASASPPPPAQSDAEQLAAPPDAAAPPAAHARTPPAAAEPAQPPAGEASDLRLLVDRTGAGLTLTFPWGEAPPAAFFRRGDHLWAVFDRRATVDLSAVTREHRALIAEAEQMPTDLATVVRFRLSDYVLASAAADETGWALVLGDEVVQPTAPIPVHRESSISGSARVALDTGPPGRLIWVNDPEVGDRVAVVTLAGPPRGVVASRNYVEFVVLSTAHGVVVQPLTDELDITLTTEAVTVFAADGLSLSDPLPIEIAGGSGGRVASPGFVDFEAWRLSDEGDFPTMDQKLNNAVAERMFDVAAAETSADGSAFGAEQKAAALFAANAALKQALYAQARFFLAHELGAEALAVLHLIAGADNTQVSEPEFLALRGAASVVAGRYEDALSDLADGSLMQDPGASLWRGLAHVGLRRWAEARRDFRDGAPVEALYPQRHRADFALAAAEAAIGAKDVADAGEQISKAQAGPLTETQTAFRDLLQADIYRLTGRLVEAAELYAQVESSEIEPHASRAAFRRILAERKLGAITSADAKQRLAAMQYRWRGDDLELRILHELGKLYTDRNEFREGLGTMRSIVSQFPDSEVSDEVVADMQEIFRELFLDGGAEVLEPVPALALYYENVDLTPLGLEGDEMIRRLADRLIAFDLLDQAAELLRHQVERRLRPGRRRAQVATDLALVYLMDREPQKALDAIRSSRHARLPGGLNRERRIIEARALAELQRYDHALELVATDRGADVDALRADIYWNTEEWSQAAGILENALGERWRDEAPLEDRERAKVMRAAIAYALADDQIALDRIRGKFAEKMSASPDADAFKVLAGRIETQGVRFRDLAGKVAESDTLDGFIAAFKAQRGEPAEDETPADEAS